MFSASREDVPSVCGGRLAIVTVVPALGVVDPAAARIRARMLRDVAKRLSARFVASQVGSSRPGLTLDDGTVVLTDNFLKVRIPPGLPRNTRVRVRIDSAALDGTVQATS